MESLGARLADPELYSSSERTAEMTELVRAQAALRSRLESLETAWLEASEALEAASAEPARAN
jgi:ATP-binding cassette subfamily F protein 3